MANVTTQKTYCRICEAHCGLEVDTNADHEVLAVRPDKTHPVSRGHVCVKGTALGALHHDPDRINHPLKKVDGTWQTIPWEQALSEIGGTLKRLRKTHGNRCLGHYTGNPTFFSAQNLLYSGALMESLGSPNLFASHSIDVNNKFFVSTEMYGLSTVQPIPDFDHCRFLMYLGSNPIVSQMSVVSLPRAMEALRGIVDRGGHVISIDPRRHETAARVGEHRFIRPGTDVWLLLAMTQVLTEEQPIDLDHLRGKVNGLDQFIAAASGWTPQRVATITGMAADDIRQLALDYAAADGAALYMSTGVNMGPFGSLSYWLVQGLSLITGNLDRRGGLIMPSGPADMLRLSRLLGLGTFDEHRTLVRGFGRVTGAFPVGTLAEEIETDHPQRIRGLIVSAGNPVHSVPGNQLREAFKRLDILVAIDIQMSETAGLADYVLPATDMLERSDYPVSHSLLMARPWAQYTEAVVPPLYERKPEWWIFSELARRAGASWFGLTPLSALPRLNHLLSMLPGLGPITPDHLLDLILRSGRQVNLKRLRANPQGLPLAPDQPGSFLGKRVPTADGRVNMAPASLLADLPRLVAMADAEPVADDKLQLIGRRQRGSHNSWMHNNPHINHDRGLQVLMHPSDAASRQIVDGGEAIIGNEKTLTLPVKLTADVMPGVIVVPHGWGHAGSGGNKARKLPGGNINEVLPDARNHLEPVSGQAIMHGHRVSVRAVKR